ncbi:unnamed protein product, partial [marine sediment metagenome]
LSMAKIALSGENGFMSTIVRNPDLPYKVNCGKILLDTVANSEREFPKKWIASNRVDVTDEFINWVLPLIGTPLPRFAKFKDIFVPKKCGGYIPVEYRKQNSI